jgi:hypothetical protein
MVVAVATGAVAAIIMETNNAPRTPQAYRIAPATTGATISRTPQEAKYIGRFNTLPKSTVDMQAVLRLRLTLPTVNITRTPTARHLL